MEGRTPARVSHDGSGNFRAAGVRYPSEAFQFDWSEDWAYVGGERIKLQVAHIKLSHSRAFLVRAYLLQTHEMLFDAYWHAFVRGILEPVADCPSPSKASRAAGSTTVRREPPPVQGHAERRPPSTRLDLARSAM
jgi:hypothetical protein